MQCETKSMSKQNENRISDTLPKRGRVTEVCKEWLIHEDGALAYQLQKEEVEQHYSGNKTRNAQVREDFPHAKDEQLREEIEARLKYQQMIAQQEEEDARIARLLAERIEKEEEDKRNRLATEDEELAKLYHRKEKLKAIEKERYPFSYATSNPTQTGDINSVGLPLVDNEPVAVNYLTHTLQSVKSKRGSLPMHEDSNSNYRSNSSNYDSITTNIDDMDNEDVENVLSDRDLEEEAIRRLQEQKDEELARLLQEQEKEENSVSLIDRDRLLAIEAQDKELAKLLQDRERAKLKRARERAKQKALLKKQQEMAENGKEDGAEFSNSPVHTMPEMSKLSLSSHSFDDMNKISPRTSRSFSKHQVTDLDAIEVMPPEPSNLPVMHNIAMAIDPTYSPQKMSSSKTNFQNPLPPEVLRSDDEYDEDLGPAPVYMPVQGQRRTASLEKKMKKNKNKDGCKQQ